MVHYTVLGTLSHSPKLQLTLILEQTLVVTRGSDIWAKGVVVIRHAIVRPYLYLISVDTNEAIPTTRQEVVSLPTNRRR